jgi:hypothetical protein
MKFTSAIFLLPFIAAAPHTPTSHNPFPDFEKTFQVYVNGYKEAVYEMNAFASQCLLLFLIHQLLLLIDRKATGMGDTG